MSDLHEILAMLTAARELEKPVTVVSHLRPDGDATGSLVAAKILLDHMGIIATAYAPDGCPLGLEEIFADASPKDMDPNTPWVFALDTARADKLGLDLENKEAILMVDHHAANNHYGSVNVVDSGAATCSLLVWELAKLAEEDNVSGAAQALSDPKFQRAVYIGIITDTGRFRHSNTNARLMRVCADILDHGLTMPDMAPFLEPKIDAHIQQRAGAAFADAKFDLDGRFLSIFVDSRDLESSDVSVLKGQLLSLMSQTKGVDGVLLMRMAKYGKLDGSLRCNTAAQWDVNQVAAHFGGGGHTAASGFSVEGLPEQDMALARKEVDKVRKSVVQILTDMYSLKATPVSDDKQA